VCDDRPRDPLDRTVREGGRRDRRNPADGHATAAERQRAGLPGGRAGAARVPLRGPVAAVCEQAPVRNVPLPAAAALLQQAPAIRASAAQAHDPGAGHGQRFLVRQPLDRRFDAGSVRNVAPGGAAIEPGRVGAVRILCVTFPVLLGASELYLVCTPAGMPVMWALASAKTGEREVLSAMLEVDAGLVATREGIVLISGKGFASGPFEQELLDQGIALLRPSRKREKERRGAPVLKKVRQLIESVNDTSRGSLTWSSTAGGLSRASRSGSPRGSWRWLRGYGTTTGSAHQSPAR
jgi:hypothetical protein